MRGHFAIDSQVKAQAVLKLQLAAYQVEAALIGVSDLPPLLEEVGDLLACGETFLAEHDAEGALIGVLGYTLAGGCVEICRLMVDPAHFRQGIATRLLETLVGEVAGWRTMRVATGSGNEPALALYRGHGFEVVATGTPGSTDHYAGTAGVHLNAYDVIVIGGGPAGLMACVGAVRQRARVLLVEKGDRLGRKLIISGGGRCNVTNAGEIEDIVKMIPGNGRFMYTPFGQFGNRDIIRFFEGLGVALKEEDHGRMFPVTDKATTVAETMIGYLREQGVEIKLHTSVERLLFEDGVVCGIRLHGGGEVRAASVVVAVGGKSVPKTGSTGDGYGWAQAVGHTVTPLFPTEVPVTLDAPWIKDKTLQGLSLREVPLTLTNAKGKKLTTQLGDMVFTHFGVSGPAALRLGHYVSVGLARGEEPLKLSIDLRPDRTAEEVLNDTLALAAAAPKKSIKNVLMGYVSERMAPLLLDLAGIAHETTYAHLPKGKWQEVVRLIKGLSSQVTGTLSIEEAFVTGGGISLKEIEPKTMGSRLVPGLYFAGEIIDVHAHTGGYNITIAFSSGHVAGTAAAKRAHALKAGG
jgi:predicted Rossmann fold flavoprotein